MPDALAMLKDRLEDLLPTIDDAPSVALYRNRGLLASDMRPCMLLLDGSEETFLSREGEKGRGRTHDAPAIMRWTPGIFAALEVRPVGRSAEYAAEFTAYRNAMLRAILNDPDLLTIVGENGDIAYRGHQTDMQDGLMMQGVLQMNFAFYYVLDTRNL